MKIFGEIPSLEVLGQIICPVIKWPCCIFRRKFISSLLNKIRSHQHFLLLHLLSVLFQWSRRCFGDLPALWNDPCACQLEPRQQTSLSCSWREHEEGECNNDHGCVTFLRKSRGLELQSLVKCALFPQFWFHPKCVQLTSLSTSVL